MFGEEAILNLLAIKQQAKFEDWYDSLMDDAIGYAVDIIAQREGIKVEEVVERN